MKNQYIAPLCEEIKVVSATSELLVGSTGPVGSFLQVTNGSGDIIAD